MKSKRVINNKNTLTEIGFECLMLNSSSVLVKDAGMLGMSSKQPEGVELVKPC
jgi:hypothetical protein